MGSSDLTARNQVLAELATLGSGDSNALTLLTQVRQLATFADQVQGELARLARLVDVTGAFAAVGYTCTAAFLRHGCGRSAARAGELVAVGRALPELRATGQALTGGQVSFDAAHEICRAVSQISDDRSAVAAEQEMLSGASRGRPGAAHSQWITPGLEPRELRRMGEDLTYRADPDAVEERQRRRFERRYLSFGLTLDDVGTISGACGDALSLDIIKTAAESFSPPGGTHDTRTSAQRRMDGLTAACQAALDSGRAGARHGALPHLTILWDGSAGPDLTRTGPGGSPPAAGGDSVDRDAGGRRADSASGSGLATSDATLRPARTGSGALLTARQVLALTCRAEISVIRWRDGLPLDVGRRYRTETPAQRRALTARDRGCRWPGCGLPAVWCTAHHIRPWQIGGTTKLPNLVLLCFVHHHYFVHMGGWTVTGSPDGLLHFTHPGGWLTLDSTLPAQPAGHSP